VEKHPREPESRKKAQKAHKDSNLSRFWKVTHLHPPGEDQPRGHCPANAFILCLLRLFAAIQTAEFRMNF
jgi:hypothetical protein